MTLREQVEALDWWEDDRTGQPSFERKPVLDLIDAHRCIDPERLARALHATVCGGGVHVTSPCMAGWADRLAAAYEKEDNL